jgi:predicted amidohydrolase YtcJ
LPAELALRAYTLDAARAAGLEADRGQLVPGKRADFLVLSANPLEVPGESIKDVQVLQTWVEGVPVMVRP